MGLLQLLKPFWPTLWLTWGYPNSLDGLSAHAVLTKDALRLVRSETPPAKRQWLDLIDELPVAVVLEDVCLANVPLVGEYWGSQVAHFMRSPTQRMLPACVASLNFIEEHVLEAVNCMAPMIKETGVAYNLVHTRAQISWIRIEPFVSHIPVLGTGPLNVVAHLSPALHCFQDSFSPAHVIRDEKSEHLGDLLEIFVYDEENIACGHHDKDVDYQNPDGTLKPLASAAAKASAELIAAFLEAAQAANPEQSLRRLLQRLFAKYVRTDALLREEARAKPLREEEQAARRKQEEAQRYQEEERRKQERVREQGGRTL